MKTVWQGTLAFCAMLLFSLALGAGPVLAQTADAETAADASEAATAEPLTEDELEVLVARIALYPDDLVAVVISSSLYPLQIVQAQRYLDEVKTKPDLKPSDKWDGSIISLLNYPDIVKMMNDDLDWTEQLGEAAVNQEEDLLVAIQQLRDKAVASNVLKSDDKVVVEKENDNVIIKSPDPQVVYVPTYPPEMLYDPTYVVPAAPIVYSDPYPSYYYPTATYWAGFVTGAVWGSVVDWNDRGVWGGDVDIDINNINNRIDFDFDKIDINNIDRDKIKNFDWKNVDRSKIDMKNVNFDKTKLKQNLERNDFNKITNKVKDRPTATGNFAKNVQGQDVRKSVQQELKGQGAGKLPKPGGATAAKLDRPTAGAELDRSAAKKPSAGQVAKKKVSKPKVAARPDNRPKKPSVIGNPGKGKITKTHSSRGQISRGGGYKGGGLKGGRPKGGGGRRR